MKKALLYLSILLLSGKVAGQDIFVKAEYPSVVNAGEQFTVMWTVNSGGGEFSAPAFTGFYKLMGPQTSYSSSTEIINGKVSSSVSYSYVYYLQAVQEGKFSLAPATFKFKSKVYSSDSLHIEVLGSTAQKQATTSAGSTQADQPVTESGGRDLFINLSVDRRDIFMGEPVVATVKIYSRVNIAGINEIKYPAFNSFLKSDIETPPLTALRQENVNGTVYGSGIVQQFLLYPQVTGDINIDPVQISVLVQKKVRGEQSDPFFGDFFSSYQTVPLAAASKPVKIRVKALPGIQPADFSGVVGKLDAKATLNKESVKVNDAVTYKVTLSGNGNLRIASAPVLKLSPDIEVYDPKITDNVKNGLNGTTGQKTFEYLLIPRHDGDFVIPPLSYSYFNIATGRYEKLTTEEFRISAKKSNEKNTGVAVYGGVAKEDVKYLGKDIRFVKNDPGNLKRTGNILVSYQSFYTAFAFSLLAFLVVLFLRREHIRRNSDVSMVKNRKAGKVAIKRLHNASECLKNNEIDQFYDEILKALWGYLSDKLNIPVSDLTRTNAVSVLQNEGIDEETIRNLTKILDTCEFARFAPSSSGAEAATIFDGASEFIKSVENLIG
jgi:hypothetical protein